MNVHGTNALLAYLRCSAYGEGHPARTTGWLAGAGLYSAGYAHRTGEGVADIASGLSSTGKQAAEGVGALFGAVKTGFSSSARQQPTVTHVYHGRDSSNNAVAIVLVGGSATLAGYWVLCWWKGWDFLGVSHKRTQEMVQQVKAGAPTL